MNIQTLLNGILNLLDQTVVPFLLAIASLVFLWGIARYFIFGGENAESQEKGKSLAMYGIMGFVIILSLWGIVNLLVSGLGLKNEPITPDYMESKL